MSDAGRPPGTRSSARRRTDAARRRPEPNERRAVEATRAHRGSRTHGGERRNRTPRQRHAVYSGDWAPARALSVSADGDAVGERGGRASRTPCRGGTTRVAAGPRHSTSSSSVSESRCAARESNPRGLRVGEIRSPDRRRALRCLSKVLEEGFEPPRPRGPTASEAAVYAISIHSSESPRATSIDEAADEKRRKPTRRVCRETDRREGMESLGHSGRERARGPTRPSASPPRLPAGASADSNRAPSSWDSSSACAGR